MTRNSPCQQSSINSVSYQGLDNGISSVNEYEVYRTEYQTDELTLQTQSYCDREPNTWSQWSECRPERLRTSPRVSSTVELLACVDVAQIEIYLYISKPMCDIPCSESDDGIQLPDKPNEYLYVLYCQGI